MAEHWLWRWWETIPASWLMHAGAAAQIQCFTPAGGPGCADQRSAYALPEAARDRLLSLCRNYSKVHLVIMVTSLKVWHVDKWLWWKCATMDKGPRVHPQTPGILHAFFQSWFLHISLVFLPLLPSLQKLHPHKFILALQIQFLTLTTFMSVNTNWILPVCILV